MGFPFSLLCDLDTLDDNYTKSSNTDNIQQLNARTITVWYKEHDKIIPRKGPEAVAFLSRLFPERRPDRVFGFIVVVDRHCISKDNISYLSLHGNFEQVPFPTNLPDFDVKIEAKLLRPTELFRHPFVVELMGAGFDKPANADYYTLRFPRVLKIHEDRSFEETISFKELQEMAKTCTELPEDGETEEAHWLKMLGGLEYQAGISSPYAASDDSDIASLTEIADDDSDEERTNKRVRKRAMASEDLPNHGFGSKRFKRRSN